MLKNYITTTYLKGKTPELDEYLWSTESNYDLEKASAQDIVKADFNDRGYQLRLLRPHLILDDTTDNEYEDVGNRNRCIVIASSVSGTATIEITGRNDSDDARVTAGTSSALVNGTNTFLLDDYYKFYIYTVTGTATIDDCFLVESANYDLLYAYMWLYLILKNKVVRVEDQFDIKATEFLRLYNERWHNFSPFYDKDEDGEITLSERSQISAKTITH